MATPSDPNIGISSAQAGTDPTVAVRIGLIEAEVLKAQVAMAGMTICEREPGLFDRDLSPLGR